MLRYLNKPAVYIPLGVLAVLAYCYLAVVRYSSYTLVATEGIIAVSIGLILAFGGWRPVYRLLIFSIPLSLELPTGLGNSKLIIPAEPLIVLLAISFAAMLLFRSGISKAFLRHPLSVLVMLYAGAMMITSFTSTMLDVSLKYTVVNVAYIFIFYFMMQEFISFRSKNILSVYYLYAWPVLPVIVYALIRHAALGFSRDSSGMVVQPYFPDHAMYSACLAMLLPFFIGVLYHRKSLSISQGKYLAALLITPALFIAIFFSYSRASWTSLVTASLFYGALRLKIKPLHILGVLLMLFSLAFIYRNDIIHNFKQNQNNSTRRNPTIEEQTKSITNISSDVSNAERINRWSCAIRMFQDKPLTGFGPGTYMFTYFPYQREDEITRISVTSAYNNKFGQGGSAHSEYLLNLAESGFLGFFLFTAIILYAIYTGMRAYFRCSDKRLKPLIAAACIGIITYSAHVFFNNYLNNAKVACLFWGSISILVILDIRGKKEKEQE